MYNVFMVNIALAIFSVIWKRSLFMCAATLSSPVTVVGAPSSYKAKRGLTPQEKLQRLQSRSAGNALN